MSLLTIASTCYIQSTKEDEQEQGAVAWRKEQFREKAMSQWNKLRWNCKVYS